MNLILLWISTAVLGALGTLLFNLAGSPGGLVFVLLVSPLIVRGDRVVGLSGLLTGFGATWLSLMAWQFASGATLANAQFWTAIGLIPLVIGASLLAPWITHGLTRSSGSPQ